MAEYNEFYETGKPANALINQLLQLLRIVWDGDLISKDDRNELVRMGFVVRQSGFQIITDKGIKYLADNKYIQS